MIQLAVPVPLLRILALWGLVRSTGNPVGSLIYAVGRADLEFKWNLGLLLVVPPSLWLGAQYGNQGLALALLVMALVFSVPGWYVLVRPLCGAGFVEYYEQMLKPLTVTLLASGISYLAILPLDSSVARLAAGLAIGGMVYVAASRWLNRQWFDAMWELLFRTSK